jgi:alkaline phosphatase D
MAQPSHPSRRRLLTLAAASASTLWLPRSAWSQPRLAHNPFMLGVASGSPRHDSVVLWTRLVQPGFMGSSALTGSAVTVRWEVAHDSAFSRIVQHGQAQALPELAHAVHVEVQGLDSDRWYFYRFMVGGGANGTGNDWVSTTGRTRTFPAPQARAQKLRLAYASCQRWEAGHYAAYRHMLDEDLDCVMFLGDYIYEYPMVAGPVRAAPSTWVFTLGGYRDRYAHYKAEPELQAMHAACPWIMTWDDHEVQNDYAGPYMGFARGEKGEHPSGFAGRRANAYQAYYEHMPLRASVLTRALAGLDSGAEMRIYGQVPFGKLANLYWVDNRQYRDDQVCTFLGGVTGSKGNLFDPAKCADWQDPKRSYLGAEQEAWLARAFADSRSTWNVLGQQTLFGQRDNRPGPSQAFWNDSWDGYPFARERLLADMQKTRLSNPVVLGGDIHENWVGHVKADYNQPTSKNVGVEFCGTSITSRSNGNSKTPERLAENPHFIFGDAERKGYGVAEFTPGKLTTTLRVVSDVAQADARIETLAQFVVEQGKSVVNRVDSPQASPKH